MEARRRNRIALLFALVVVLFLLRGPILHAVLDWKLSSLAKKYSLEFRYRSASFSSVKTLNFTGISLVSLPSDTLLTIDTLQANPRILPLLLGRKRLLSLLIHGMDARLNSTLLELWLNRQKKDTLKAIAQQQEADYSNTLNELESKLFVTIPRRVDIRDASFTYRRDSLYSTIRCLAFTYQRNLFRGTFTMADNYSNQPFTLDGEINTSSRKISVAISHPGHGMVKLPYLGPRWNAQAGFDSLYCSLSFVKRSGGETGINGEAAAVKLLLAHKKIGPIPVKIAAGIFSFHFVAGHHFIELDSSSVVNMNGFTFSPFIKYENTPSRKLTMAIARKEFTAQSLFNSLPDGLFMSFKGIRMSGSFEYQMQASLDIDHPDSVALFSRLKGHDLAVLRSGQTDLAMISRSFMHEVYDDDRWVDSIWVGPENPDFVPLDKISPYLQYAVLTGEDGGFFFHRGFSIEAIKSSISENLKENRFARGGSTLTMQLVKNVYLNSRKTISRKLEEMLIVWLIENMHLVSKERMFEVYLNIIEWGPGIYGIKPAARYYFRKDPSSLNLKESIFLSAIVPRPKGFKYNFVNNGELKPYLADYYRLVCGFMLRRGQIQPSDTVNLNIHLTLTGDAKYELPISDTTRTDTLLFIPPGPVLSPDVPNEQ